MKTINKQTQHDVALVGKQRSYGEIVAFLDQHWSRPEDNHISCIKKLDLAFGSIAKKLNTILVSGSNGKSLTMNFTAQLLNNEQLSVGLFYAPHMLTYNERFGLNNTVIDNKAFTDLANQVLNTAEAEGLKADTLDILTMMAFLYFEREQVEVAIFEVNKNDPIYTSKICTPKIVAITRIENQLEPSSAENKADLAAVLDIVQPSCHVVSADQSKLNLQTMLEIVEEKQAVWAMPIRKLATLAYPFEQLHGRCAALAERIGEIYINSFVPLEERSDESLLAKQRGQRGRPTLEAKKQSELHPKKTLEQFWQHTINTLPSRFQVIEHDKPLVLLDNANNLDAFDNLLLGIRLLHYQRPLKGLSLIIGCNNPDLNNDKFLKLLRYFFKKTSGNIIVCPVTPKPGDACLQSFDAEQVTNDIKSMKIKARSSKSFKEAFELAMGSVDERQGLIVVAGSSSLIEQFWNYKNSKTV
jgi:dihydrofolate synthase/folylpolyglutamate synthase